MKTEILTSRYVGILRQVGIVRFPGGDILGYNKMFSVRICLMQELSGRYVTFRI